MNEKQRRELGALALKKLKQRGQLDDGFYKEASRRAAVNIERSERKKRRRAG